MTDLIERAKAALEGYTDDDIKDSEHLSFARLAIAAGELADEVTDWKECNEPELIDAIIDNLETKLARFRAIVEGKE